MTTKELSANELADELDKLDTKIMIKGLKPNDLLSAEVCAQAATMLRKLQAENTDLLFHIDIQKVVGRDLDMGFLKAGIRERDGEIESLKAKYEPKTATGYVVKDGSERWI